MQINVCNGASIAVDQTPKLSDVTPCTVQRTTDHQQCNHGLALPTVEGSFHRCTNQTTDKQSHSEPVPVSSSATAGHAMCAKLPHST